LWIFATPALVILGEPYLRETWTQAAQGRVTSSALVVLGVGAAYAYSVFATIEGSEQVYFDTATMVLMLFTVGSYIEAAGRAKAARDLEPLLAAESECATVVDEGSETRRPVRDIGAGMRVRVRPGERIPADGVVVEGLSHADEAVITGESRQVAKRAGSSVIAGSINIDGPLLIQSSGAGSATRWAQICRSVRDALSRRSPMQRIADRVVGISVPVVLILGGLTVAYWAQLIPFDRALLIESPGEDVKYQVDTTNGQNYLVRYDRFAPAGSNQSTVLANRIDSLAITYWGPGNTALNVAADPLLVANAVGVRIVLSVNLLAVGKPGAPGYQPATTVQLTSDVALRNKSENLSTY